MSRIQETQRAYDKLVELLNQEIRKRSGSTQELERFRQTLDVAFYLLGWGQFEYLVRKEAEERIEGNARAHTLDGHAWRYLKENVKNFPVRRRLELIFHESPSVRGSLNKEYTVRNEAAHDYKLLPKEAKDISGWLKELEELVDKF
jgi:GAF domain-containing protein